MPPSRTEIANMSLALLGMKPITNISDTVSVSARTLQSFWDASRDDVFSEHRWAFANTQQLLAVVESDLLGWQFFYGYPSNCARIWTVFNELTYVSRESQEFETLYAPDSNTRIIGSMNETAWAELTYIVSDVTIWDAKFIIAFSYRLAANAAPFLVGDNALKLSTNLMTLYNAQLNEAKRIGSAEKIKVPYQTSSYKNVR